MPKHRANTRNQNKNIKRYSKAINIKTKSKRTIVPVLNEAKT